MHWRVSKPKSIAWARRLRRKVSGLCSSGQPGLLTEMFPSTLPKDLGGDEIHPGWGAAVTTRPPTFLWEGLRFGHGTAPLPTPASRLVHLIHPSLASTSTFTAGVGAGQEGHHLGCVWGGVSCCPPSPGWGCLGLLRGGLNPEGKISRSRCSLRQV